MTNDAPQPTFVAQLKSSAVGCPKRGVTAMASPAGVGRRARQYVQPVTDGITCAVIAE